MHHSLHKTYCWRSQNSSLKAPEVPSHQSPQGAKTDERTERLWQYLQARKRMMAGSSTAGLPERGMPAHWGVQGSQQWNPCCEPAAGAQSPRSPDAHWTHAGAALAAAMCVPHPSLPTPANAQYHKSDRCKHMQAKLHAHASTIKSNHIQHLLLFP